MEESPAGKAIKPNEEKVISKRTLTDKFLLALLLLGIVMILFAVFSLWFGERIAPIFSTGVIFAFRAGIGLFILYLLGNLFKILESRKRGRMDKLSLICVFLGIIFMIVAIFLHLTLFQLGGLGLFVLGLVVKIGVLVNNSFILDKRVTTEKISLIFIWLGAEVALIIFIFIPVGLYRVMEIIQFSAPLLVLGVITKMVEIIFWHKSKTVYAINPSFYKKLAVVLILLFFVVFFVFSLGLFEGAAKPVIYLYPENTMNISIALNIPNGYITTTNPKISAENSWDVTAQPTGKIITNGEQYPYLFYESEELRTFSINTGWVVQGNNISNWFNETLPKMGLDGNETKDFVGYWSQHLPSSDYYLISLLNSSQLEQVSNLNITPKPNTMIRIILVIQKLDKQVVIAEPNITTPQRKGFTVVEWGVIPLGFSSQTSS